MASKQDTSGSVQNSGKKTVPPVSNARVGSGSDANSDLNRLSDEENRLDKTQEDTFPASDAPSRTPITGIGSAEHQALAESHLPDDFKDNKAAQFEYGRRSQQSTLHFDPDSKRLYRGNPDVGEVDLGTIEADAPAEPDDNDHNDGDERSGPEY